MGAGEEGQAARTRGLALGVRTRGQGGRRLGLVLEAGRARVLGVEGVGAGEQIGRAHV